jgi:GNAT superfamily N-acetyltransferase
MQTIREMKTEDVDAVVKIIASQSEEDAEAAEPSYREVGGIMDQYVIEEEGQLIGVTGFVSPPGCEQTHWLSWTYIDENHTNKGHGRKMLDELLEVVKDQGGRKIFVKVSDYIDDEDGDIYAAALHLYKSLGFKVELTHKDYYTEGEAQIVLGLRLKDEVSNSVEQEHCPVQFNAVFEIDETDDAYSFGWHDEGESAFNQDDVKVGLDQVKDDEGRVVFLSFPSNFIGVRETLLASGFANAGVLDDYYEDGIHDQHFTYRF